MISFRQIRKAVSPVSEPEPTQIPESARREFCAATGMSPIDDFKPEDVLIVGYPKSGNTWMQYLIASAIYQLDVTTAPDALVQDLVPDVHFKRFFKRYFPVAFFKSHFLPRKDYRRVVYLLRDGRDAMVSYLHFIEGVTGNKLDFLDLVKAKEGLFPSKWHEHVEQWLANPFQAEMIVVRYEDLKRDTVGEMQRICKFAGFERDRAVLEKAAEQSSFSSMKKREQTFPWESPNIPKNKQFVRRGEVGSHKDEMPEAAREFFLSEAGAMLRQTGYLK